jgi:hypothetical protein
MDIPVILSNYYRGQVWTLNGEKYEGLTWSDENTLPKPTLEELISKYEEHRAAQPLKKLRDKRNQVLEQTDRYVTIDYPHATDEEKQKRLVQRQTLRDLPTLVTPIEDGSMKLWVTNENGSLQDGDGLVISSNVEGYFTKGEPSVVTVRDACDFSASTTETYYSNIVSVTRSNVVVTSETEEPGYVENCYWTSSSISHYEGNAVSHYSNVVIYDGVSVYTNVQVGEYSNLATEIQEGYTAVVVSNVSPVEIEGYEPVIVYSNVSSDRYDANVHTEYTKVITHYSNISVVEEVAYSNITDAEYANLNTEYVVTPGYTSFFHEVSNTSIRVEQYAALTTQQREEYAVQTVAPVTSNLQTHYTAQTREIPHAIRELDGGIRAQYVLCQLP